MTFTIEKKRTIWKQRICLKKKKKKLQLELYSKFFYEQLINQIKKFGKQTINWTKESN